MRSRLERLMAILPTHTESLPCPDDLAQCDRCDGKHVDPAAFDARMCPAVEAVV